MTQISNPFNDYVFLQATPAERGSFTLATDKALAKLEKFQLPDPTFFILQWVQAMVASGAQKIDISYDGSNLKNEFELAIAFDGPGYEQGEVDNLYDHVFLSGRDRSVDRLRELALGWLSACSLPITLMTFQSKERRRVRQLVGRKMEENCEGVSSSGLTPSSLHELRIKGKGNYPFEDILTRRCSELPCELRFGDSLLSFSSSGGVPWPNHAFSRGATKGHLGATYGGSVSSHITFLRYGVEFTSRSEPSLQPPVIVRVSDPSLSKNVSQTDLVRDEAYESFLGRLRIEMKDMGLQLTRSRIPQYQREALNRFIQSYLVAYIDVRVFDDPERLDLMGDEFRNLIEFPLFRVAGKPYISLLDLKKAYDESGYLLYSVDERAVLTRWDGLLLILEPEEVLVLKKFFSSLTAISFEELKLLRVSGFTKIISSQNRPIAAQTSGSVGRMKIVEGRVDASFENHFKKFSCLVPDTYPTGQVVVCRRGASEGRRLPGVSLTLRIEPEKEDLSSDDLAQLKSQLKKPVQALLLDLCTQLSSPDVEKNQSRSRYAELACELFLFRFQEEQLGLNGRFDSLESVVLHAPIIGLEDGSLASLWDLKTYADLEGSIFVGGAFEEGLESGALDPMPFAEQLIPCFLEASQLVSTASVRKRLSTEPEIRLKFRKQTLIPGLGKDPAAAKTLQNFSSAEANQAQELEKIKEDYERAMEQKIFVEPSPERLEELEIASFADEGFDSFGKEPPQEVPVQVSSPLEAQAPRRNSLLPSLDSELSRLRQKMGDFCSVPGAVHVETRGESYSFHLSLTWEKEAEARVLLLRVKESQALLPLLPVEGFIRVAPDCDLSGEAILSEATEQILTKTIQVFKNGPSSLRLREKLRICLFKACKLMHQWRQDSPAIAHDLLQLQLVPCRGKRYLSFKQLARQAKEMGYTAHAVPETFKAEADPVCDVIAFQEAWLKPLLEALDFPELRVWREAERKLDFDMLLQHVWKDVACVLNGQDPDLIGFSSIDTLPRDSSLWSRWRAGFLSWDKDEEKALVNPEHSLGKKLLKRYTTDPIWSSIFGCALFSTINRGLEEVEDHHEYAFLMGLLDNFE